MNKHVSFNFHILPAEKTFITAVSSAALYGKGVFTTLAVYNSKLFLWDKHWRRLRQNAVQIGIDLSGFEEKIVKHAVSDLVLLNNLKNGRARLTFFDESAGRIWNLGVENKPSLFITTAEVQNPKDNLLLTVSPFPVNSRSPLAGVKSCNYLENLLALEEAQKRGFDEAVRLNEKGEIVSASTANIFWVKDEKIFTPHLETGCLAGTTRELLVENFPVTETGSKIKELSKADEIFLTSAGIGICSASFETVKKGKSSTAAKLREFFETRKLQA
jgi:branched-subunit amino acid aminotransferase/4-amino-4-deoxychorismate lyase